MPGTLATTRNLLRLSGLLILVVGVLFFSFIPAQQPAEKPPCPNIIPSNNGLALVHATSSLEKRKDPTIDACTQTDTTKGWKYVPEYYKLLDAIEDMRTMVHLVLEYWFLFGKVRSLYWLDEDHEDVKRVFLAMMPEQLEPDSPWSGDWVEKPEFSEIMGRFRIPEWNIQLQEACKSPYCFAGTINWTDEPNNPFSPSDDPSPGYARPFSQTMFCPLAFNTDFFAMRLKDRQCEDFIDPDIGTYAMHWKMDSLAQTMLHEAVHFNEIGKAIGSFGPLPSLSFPDPPVDINSRAWIDDYVYGQRESINARDRPGVAKHNADSYAWYAAQVYWTMKCSTKLKDQNEKGLREGTRKWNWFNPATQNTMKQKWEFDAVGNGQSGSPMDVVAVETGGNPVE